MIQTNGTDPILSGPTFEPGKQGEADQGEARHHGHPAASDCDARTVSEPSVIQAAEERDNRAAEKRFWDSQLRISKWLNVITAAAAIIGLGGLVILGLTLWQTQRQMVLDRPPKLTATHFEIWQAGQGQPFSPRNQPPPMTIPGLLLDGDLTIGNDGGGTATFQDGKCVAYWGGDRLPMESPLIPLPGGLALSDFDALEGYKFSAPAKRPTNLSGAGTAACRFRTAARSGNLYVLGWVRYLDRFGGLHSLYFARRYDPTYRAFVRVKDEPDYENESE